MLLSLDLGPATSGLLAWPEAIGLEQRVGESNARSLCQLEPQYLWMYVGMYIIYPLVKQENIGIVEYRDY